MYNVYVYMCMHACKYTHWYIYKQLKNTYIVHIFMNV